LAVQGSQTRLRARVKELLGEAERSDIASEAMAGVVTKVDEMLEVDPSDARHMFWEEMKRLFYAMREIELEDLDEETMDDFLAAMDGVSNVLLRVERRRQERQKTRGVRQTSYLTELRHWGRTWWGCPRTSYPCGIKLYHRGTTLSY
jgi:hypothetical protein